ncbi:MAG: hypothetical protein LBU70_05110 [Chitinispirillales bacterium]|jgi:hypothetical protein|nr:hypothetical protein [Chitinispirillales bacterium]
MRKIKIWIFISGLIILSLPAVWWSLAKTNPDFATTALLNLHVMGEYVTIEVTDAGNHI